MIYCRECEYFNPEDGYSSAVRVFPEQCRHPDNWRTVYVKEGGGHADRPTTRSYQAVKDNRPKQINKNNNCGWFKAKSVLEGRSTYKEGKK